LLMLTGFTGTQALIISNKTDSNKTYARILILQILSESLVTDF
jgi:hypothetical protein